MKFTTITATLLSIITPLVSAGTGTASWDSVYDNGATSTLSVACSDGVNGLYTKGYHTLGSIPKFPMVGAAPTIAGWNSPNCGKCFAVTYKGNTVYITGVDTSRSTTDFVLSKAALNKLTGGLADQTGRFPVSWTQLASGANCGMP